MPNEDDASKAYNYMQDVINSMKAKEEGTKESTTPHKIFDSMMEEFHKHGCSCFLIVDLPPDGIVVGAAHIGEFPVLSGSEILIAVSRVRDEIIKMQICEEKLTSIGETNPH